MEKWKYEGCAKICVKVTSEEEIIETQKLAEAKGIVTFASARSVLALGPAPK